MDTNGQSNGQSSGQSNRIADVIRNAPSERDPSSRTRGAPPNFGRFVLPQIVTLQSLATSIARVYRPSDEALNHSYESARFMRNDCGVMECVEARQRSVALLDWHLEPEDANSQEQKDLCAELTKILNCIPFFMQYRESLLNAVWYGRYANQHKYEWEQVGGRMRVLPVRWLPINGDKLVFRIEDDPFRRDEQVGIRVGPAYSSDSYLPDKRHKIEMTERGMAYFLEPWERRLLAIHKHQIEDGSYEAPWDAGKIHGVGIRSKIYWDWFQKQELLGLLMEYLERAAFGIQLWFYPAGNPQAKAETEAAAKSKISNGKLDLLVPVPMGEDASQYGVQHIEPGLGGVEALKDILATYFGHRIKRYIMGQTLTSEADATGLGSGVADIHLNTWQDIARYDAMNLQERISRDLLEPVKNWNFPEAKGIRVKFVIDTQSKDALEKLQAFKLAFDMLARIKEKDVLDAIGAAPPNENDVVLQNPVGQQQQRLWEQAHGMQGDLADKLEKRGILDDQPDQPQDFVGDGDGLANEEAFDKMLAGAG